jgi:hypothetical protein
MTLPLKQPKMNQHMQFIDSKSQLKIIRSEIDAAIKHVLEHGIFIMGPDSELEKGHREC